jgi:hypothetical protein
MPYRNISSVAAALLLFNWSMTLLAADGDEVIQELTNQCQLLAKSMARENKDFPQEPIKRIKGLVTWHAALCGERPKGEGTVTALCDGQMASGKNIFFWQKQTKNGNLQDGFVTCR